MIRSIQGALSAGGRALCVLIALSAQTIARQCESAGSSETQVVTLENEWLRIDFCRQSGRIAQIRNKAAGLNLVLSPSTEEPWRIQRTDRILNQFYSCKVEKSNDLHDRLSITCQLRCRENRAADDGDRS
ncbi:MAG: hypothetical protein U0930_18510 [Pirellulales bacterium]